MQHLGSTLPVLPVRQRPPRCTTMPRGSSKKKPPNPSKVQPGPPTSPTPPKPTPLYCVVGRSDGPNFYFLLIQLSLSPVYRRAWAGAIRGLSLRAALAVLAALAVATCMSTAWLPAFLPAYLAIGTKQYVTCVLTTKSTTT